MGAKGGAFFRLLQAREAFPLSHYFWRHIKPLILFDWDTAFWPLQMNPAGKQPCLPYLTRDLQRHFPRGCLEIKMWAHHLFEVGHASFRNLISTLAEVGQQCPCNLRGEKKRIMKQTDWEMNCWLSHIYRLALPGKNIVSKDANWSSHSLDCFSSSEFSVICSLSKQNPKCVHVLYQSIA